MCPTSPAILVRASQAWGEHGANQRHFLLPPPIGQSLNLKGPRFKDRTQVSRPRPTGRKQSGKGEAATRRPLSQAALPSSLLTQQAGTWWTEKVSITSEATRTRSGFLSQALSLELSRGTGISLPTDQNCHLCFQLRLYQEAKPLFHKKRAGHKCNTTFKVSH